MLNFLKSYFNKNHSINFFIKIIQKADYKICEFSINKSTFSIMNLEFKKIVLTKLVYSQIKEIIINMINTIFLSIFVRFT